MSNILMIVGLPGSGKSTLAENINKDNGNKYRIIDDPVDYRRDILPFINEDIIITDPQLCFEKHRESAVKKIKENSPEAKIDWIFFENNPDACLVNSRIRGMTQIPAKKVESFIKNFNKFYTIPEGSTTVRVYSI